MAYLVTFLTPQLARHAWLAVMMAGIGGSITIGMISAKRESVNSFDATLFSAFLVFIAFGLVRSVGIGRLGGRELTAFWASYFMLPYILLGLWLGRALVAIGVAVTALTFAGYL